jgi:hypothetical protein
MFSVMNAADAGAGSLRQAILDSNNTPGLNTIAFDINNGGAVEIQPLSALPDITNPVIIDGTTQPGFSGAPLVILNGTQEPFASGLVIGPGGGSTIKV